MNAIERLELAMVKVRPYLRRTDGEVTPVIGHLREIDITLPEPGGYYGGGIEPISRGPGPVVSSSEEGRAFAAGSAFPGPFYRGTSHPGVGAYIPEHTPNASTMGRGVYAVRPKGRIGKPAKLETWGEVQEVYIDVRKPLNRFSPEVTAMLQSDDAKALRETFKAEGVHPVGPEATAAAVLQALAQARGYDALWFRAENGDIVISVFDARKVATVVKPGDVSMGMPATDRLLVKLAQQRVFVPRHPRLKAGRIEDVESYNYMRERATLRLPTESKPEARPPGTAVQVPPEQRSATEADDRIVKVNRVVDTREWDDNVEPPKPIPGSGDARQCDRCGRMHEVHVFVQLGSGREAIIGSSCARKDEMSVVRKAVASAKTVDRLEHQLAKAQVRHQAALEAWAKVEAMEPPEIVMAERDEKRTEWRMGDSWVWQHDTDPINEERREALLGGWRDKRLHEAGGEDAWKTSAAVEDLEKRLKRARKAMEKANQVELAIQVKAYLKRSPSGHIEPVVAHERTGNPAAPPGITPLKPLGPPPTPTPAPAPATAAPEARTAPSREGRFTLPATPIEAARAEYESAQTDAAAKLTRLEALSDDEFRSLMHSDQPNPPGTDDLYSDPLTSALWHEQTTFPKTDTPEGKAKFKKAYPEDAARLGIARNEVPYKRALTARFHKIWKQAKPQRTNPEQRALITSQSEELFTEPKMQKAAAVFGEPDLFVAFDSANVATAGSSEVPVAEFRGHNKIVFYESSDTIDTPEERIESKPFTGDDPGPAPGDVVTNGHGESKSVKGTLRHEYGHMVADKITPFGYPPDWRKLWDAASTKYNERVAARVKDRSLEELKAISYYAMENPREGWAEAFAIVMHPEYDRSKWKGVIGEDLLDFVSEELKRQGVEV